MAAKNPSGGLLSRLLHLGKPANAGAPTSDIDDFRAAISFGNKIIFLGFGLFLLWASLAPIDEGVPATGVVAVESLRKVMTHMTGGTVQTVLVHENQSVQAGDVLLTFDDTKARSTFDSVMQDYIGMAAKLARLEAEHGQAHAVQFSDELQAYALQMGRADLLRGQEQLFKLRQQTLESEQAILRENLSASGGQVSGMRQQLAARSHQASLLTEEIKEARPLVAEGFIARTKLMDQERQLAELTSVTSELQARIAREISSSAEIRLRLAQRKQEFLRDVENQIADTRREVSTLRERLKEAQADLERTVVRAPVSGQVVSLQAQTPGAAITPGFKMLEIVPAGDKLLLDVQIPTHIINRVVPGLPTDIRLNAFPELPQLVIKGTVESVSQDRHEVPNGQPYYLARVGVTQEGVAELHGRKLRPGMPVEVIIKTGERSFLMYILKPLMRRMFTAFEEA